MPFQLLTFEEDFGLAPMEIAWRGARKHIGPVETVTPFIDRLSSKTTCATLTLMAGVMAWGCHRLRHFADQSYNYELIEASFAFHHDWRYLDYDAGPGLKEPDQPAQASATLALNRYFLDSMDGEKPWNSYFQPIMHLSHMAHIVHFILPKPWQPRFHDWLFMACDRLDTVARKPEGEYRKFNQFPDKASYRNYCAPHRGSPLPPEILVPETIVENREVGPNAHKFLMSLDPAKNRYLRPQAAMDELGFNGKAYG